MKKVKVAALGLVLGVAGAVYAANSAAQVNPATEKAAGCCSMANCCEGGSCQTSGACCAAKAK